MNKTIGVLAHVDAGKTTFSEQILYHTNSIRARGRVDHKNAYLDSHDIEKDRGITIFSDQGVFIFNESMYYLIDTPGHVDFSAEMERAVQAMDYAIIIISAVEGVQGHTETVWQLLRNQNIPTFFFINKIDRVGADIEQVLDEIRSKMTEDCLFFPSGPDIDFLNKDIIESIAERNDLLFERYLSGHYEKDTWLSELRIMIKNSRMFPCMAGSALQDIGILEFLNLLDELTVTDYSPDGEFGGRVYKIRYDGQGNRVTYIKALNGTLFVKDKLCYGEIGQDGNRPSEKVNQIRIYNGNKFRTAESAAAGEAFAVTGLTNVNAGEGVGTVFEKSVYKMVPTLKSKVIFDSSLNIKDLLSKLKLLEVEDPALNVVWNESLQEIHVHIMGVIQLEVLKQIVAQRFSIAVEFGPCQVLYKETITEKAIGYGHFEPLKHYAEVHLRLKPAPRNSGISFNSTCHIDNLMPSYQNLIRTHIFEKEHHGVLAGAGVTDVKITLLTGRAHQKHTSGGDFREAALRALRQGLEKAQCILLEPYYRFKIEAELDSMGRILSDVQKLQGTFEPPQTAGTKVIINGRGPVAAFMNYSIELVSFTKGKGSISLFFDGYDSCHNEAEVIKSIGYNKDADPEYTSNSIFCAKGAGYPVEGSKAEEYMHCL
jgi:small GTP-binding protein